eukprot:Hpha_TRINITY_DN15306_c0_g1::TRINITY_DN15306_c0_g1_i1::g.92346::m.92346
MMKVTFVAAALPLMAAACDLTFHNTLSEKMTLCVRKNAAVPGNAGKIELDVNKSVSVPCHTNSPTEFFQTLFPVRGFNDCVLDACTGASPPYGTCKHYPYVLGQGVSADNGNWYGSIGYNWDGDGQGWKGNYSGVGYGLRLDCTAYHTNKINDVCGPTGCTPNKPTYGLPSSGVELCDTNTSITITIVQA